MPRIVPMGGGTGSPTGAAGGVLGGTYPNPTMAAGAASANIGSLSGDLTGTLPTPTLTHYRTILRGSTRGQASIITGAATYLALVQGASMQANSVAGANVTPLYIQPTDWAATGKTTSLRLLVGCLVTDTAPAITFTFGLYPVTAWAGGTTVSTWTLGTVVSGSTVAFASPAANSLTAETSSGDFAIPSAGFYAIGAATSGAGAANSNPMFPYALQVRNV